MHPVIPHHGYTNGPVVSNTIQGNTTEAKPTYKENTDSLGGGGRFEVDGE